MNIGLLQLNPAGEHIAADEMVIARARIRAGHPTIHPVVIGAEVLTVKYDTVTVIANPNASKTMDQAPRMKHPILLKKLVCPNEPVIVVQVEKSPIDVRMKTGKANVVGVIVIMIETGSGPVATGQSHQRKVSIHPGITPVVSSAATVMKPNMRVEKRNLRRKRGIGKRIELEKKIGTENGIGIRIRIRISPGAVTGIESAGNVTVIETGRQPKRHLRDPTRKKTLIH